MIQDASFVALLKQIQLLLKPQKYRYRLGLHPMRHQGRSTELVGHREYCHGDELRDLDWKVYARTDRFYVKQRDAHTSLKVLIIVDDSLSMNFQSEEANSSKFRAALSLAFALGYILHQQRDAFAFQTLHQEKQGLPKALSSKRAFQHFTSCLVGLDCLQAQGGTDLSFRHNRPQSYDHVYFISDFMVPEEVWGTWIQQLLPLGGALSCFRVLDPLELTPNRHLHELQDIENRSQYRFIDEGQWRHYQQNFQEHEAQLQYTLKIKNIPLASLNTQGALNQNIYHLLTH